MHVPENVLQGRRKAMPHECRCDAGLTCYIKITTNRTQGRRHSLPTSRHGTDGRGHEQNRTIKRCISSAHFAPITHEGKFYCEICEALRTGNLSADSAVPKDKLISKFQLVTPARERGFGRLYSPRFRIGKVEERLFGTV